MIYNIILAWARIFLRTYFRRSIIIGRENIPADGPLIVASNHPSAFLEASVLATSIGRPVHFLVRGDMFNPKFQWLFDWTNQIPIFRQKDGIQNLRKNASSFDLSYRKLGEGNAILIFPEAKTVLEKKLRPIQRGTAHLAFGASGYLKENEYIKMLPVGVNFTEPRVAGTDVIVHFAPAYDAPKASREDREAIDEFTQKLEDAMVPLVVTLPEEKNERFYEAALSLYLNYIYSPINQAETSRIANAIASEINSGAELGGIQDYTKTTEKHLQEGKYFPKLISSSLPVLIVGLLFKCIWFLSGGWIWRLIRYLVFSKIRTNTFQSPTAIGAAMVVYALLFLIGLILVLTGALPLLCITLWPIVLFAGKLTPATLKGYWESIMLSSGIKKKLIAQQQEITEAIKKL